MESKFFNCPRHWTIRNHEGLQLNLAPTSKDRIFWPTRVFLCRWIASLHSHCWSEEETLCGSDNGLGPTRGGNSQLGLFRLVKRANWKGSLGCDWRTGNTNANSGDRLRYLREENQKCKARSHWDLGMFRRQFEQWGLLVKFQADLSPCRHSRDHCAIWYRSRPPDLTLSWKH